MLTIFDFEVTKLITLLKRGIALYDEAVININYWKEIRKELTDTVNNIHGRVIIIHNSMELSDIIKFLNKIRQENPLVILYISLIKSYNFIQIELGKNPLENKKLFVVDCASGYIQDSHDTKDCIFRNTPSNLGEMKKLIKEGITCARPNLIVIDSLSQFINFANPRDNELHDLYKFLQSIREDFLGLTCYAVILLYDDIMNSIKKLPTMFTDLVLKIEVIKEKTNWRD